MPGSAIPPARLAGLLLLFFLGLRGASAQGFIPVPPAPIPPPFELLGSVPLPGVEGRLDHLAVDVATQRIYVAALEAHAVEVVDLVKRERIHELTGISEPQGLAFLRSAKRLLVASRGDGTLRSFDATTYAPGPWVDLGRNADNVRVDAAEKMVYVGAGDEPGPGLLAAIAVSAFLPADQGGTPAPPRSPADLLVEQPRQANPTATLELACHPASFQLDPDGDHLYANLPDTHEIAVIKHDGDKLVLAGKWPATAAKRHFAMAVDPTAKRVYVAFRDPAGAQAFDTDDGTPTALYSTGADADDMFLDDAHRRLYIICGGLTAPTGTVECYEIAAGGQLMAQSSLPTKAKARTGLFIPELKLLVVAVPHVGDQPAALLLYRLTVP